MRVSAHKMAWWARRQLHRLHIYVCFCFTAVWTTKQNESHLIQPASSSHPAFLSNVVLSRTITASSPLLLLLLLLLLLFLLKTLQTCSSSLLLLGRTFRLIYLYNTRTSSHYHIHRCTCNRLHHVPPSFWALTLIGGGAGSV
jgi:hypothetical protein